VNAVFWNMAGLFVIMSLVSIYQNRKGA
jgi:uncharacterized membrane protein